MNISTDQGDYIMDLAAEVFITNSQKAAKAKAKGPQSTSVLDHRQTPTTTTPMAHMDPS